MAATAPLGTATPYALKYIYGYDGNGSLVVVKTAAEMIVDAATAGPGPSAMLARLIAENAAGNWAGLARRGVISLYVTPETPLVAASQIGALFNNVGGENRLTITGLALANGDVAVVEVRFNHTFDR